MRGPDARTGGGLSGTLHGLVRRWWDGGGGAAGVALRALAMPAEAAFRAAGTLRNRRWDRRGGTRVEGVAVVSVGNLTVGGTGKTPVAAWAARHLAREGWRCAVLTRGDHRDEILLHLRWNPAVPVVGMRDRIAAAREAAAAGAEVLVVDDGFQHRALARDLDVVLLAAEDRFPGALLPRGPYREPPGALTRAGVVLVTRRVASSAEAEETARVVGRRFPHLAVGRMAFDTGAWTDLDGEPAPPPSGPLVAVAGIARPDAFALQVARYSHGPVTLLAYPDHHRFTLGDVRAMRGAAGGRTVVVTEKDAVKLATFGDELPTARVLGQTLRWESGEEAVKRRMDEVAERRG